MNLFIGLDLGTSTYKGVLVSESGEIVAKHALSTTFSRLPEGKVEFSAEDNYELMCQLISYLAEKASPEGQIIAISMAAASGNTLLLDENFLPLLPGIHWFDKRPSPKGLVPEIDPDQVHPLVGWPYLDSFPLAHLSWLKTNQSGTYSQARYVGMNINYLLYHLTGKWVSDPSTATTFYLQDQVKKMWYPEYLSALELDAEKLPIIKPSGTVIGNLTKEAAESCSLKEQIQVFLGSFDHPAAARATGTVTEGKLLLSCGTSWVGFFPVFNRDAAIEQNLLVDPFLQPDGPWGAMFSVPGIGETIDLLVDKMFSSDDKYRDFSEAATKVPPGANGLAMDLNDPDQAIEACEENSPESVSRAIMEAAVFLVKEKLAIVEKINGNIPEEITMVGGPSGNATWVQITADILGLPIKLSANSHAGALGAALMAGIGAGTLADLNDALKQTSQQVVVIHPDAKQQKIYAARKNSTQ